MTGPSLDTTTCATIYFPNCDRDASNLNIVVDDQNFDVVALDIKLDLPLCAPAPEAVLGAYVDVVVDYIR